MDSSNYRPPTATDENEGFPNQKPSAQPPKNPGTTVATRTYNSSPNPHPANHPQSLQHGRHDDSLSRGWRNALMHGSLLPPGQISGSNTARDDNNNPDNEKSPGFEDPTIYPNTPTLYANPKHIIFHHTIENPEDGVPIVLNARIISINKGKILENLIKGDEVVVPGVKRMIFNISYPLKKDVCFGVNADDPQKGFTRKDILSSIGMIYETIYQTENATCSEPAKFSEPDDDDICSRSQTDGKYSIKHWGLGDLYLRAVIYNDEEKHWEVDVSGPEDGPKPT